tara:strand:+ start:4799 stop:8917 length:4119 start_codon:yes stop_codon:yes gene_type:complete
MTENKVKPVRPSRQNIPPLQGNSIFEKPSKNNIKLKIAHGGTQEIDALAKFAQLIMYGIALLAIWGGILSIAFAENATNQNFLVLGIGGVISSLMAIGLVEVQRRKGGKELQSVHDYLLGIGFFFAAVGILWGTRYLIGLMASQGFDLLLVEDVPYSDENWVPSANGIYFQLVACIILIFSEYFYVKQLEGETAFGWSVITFTPLALVIAGVGPWLTWSENIVSWELGISIVGMSLLSMWLALESNKSLIFSITAVVSGLIPILYELLNDAGDINGKGGALSLLVFIVIGQGILAADERVRKDLMQLTSFFLIGEVLIAILLVREGELNLILGPIRESMLNEAAAYINLQSVLWITVLLAYFPAVHKQRIPWMPIGLAGSIWLLTPEASIIIWVITLIILPYMLIFAKATRSWVANATFIATAASFFLQDSVNFWGDTNWLDTYVVITIAIALVVIGELGRNFGPLNNWSHFLGVGLIVLSESILFNGGPLISWLMVTYILGTAWKMLYHASLTNNEKDRLEASLLLLVSLIFTISMAISNRLILPIPDNIITFFDGSDPSIGVLAIVIWVVFRKFRFVEFDLKVIFHWLLDNGQKNIPAYDMKDGTWITSTGGEIDENYWSQRGIGIIGRSSLIGPLLLLSISITNAIITGDSGKEAFWVCFMIIPISILIWELVSQENVSSNDRVLSSWILVLIAFPISMELNWLNSKYLELYEDTDKLVNPPKFIDIYLSNLIFDILLILGPIILTVILMNRGLDKENKSYEADKWAFLGLLGLALLDSTGGLALLVLYGIVIFNSINYRHFLILCIAPIIFFIAEDNMIGDGRFIGIILEKIDLNNYSLAEITIFGLPRFSCLIIALTGGAILIRSMIDNYYKHVDVREMPNIAGGLWLAIGIWGILPEASWLLCIVTLALTLQNWFSGKLNFIPWAPVSMTFSLLVALTLDDNYSQLSGTEILSYTSLGVGLFSLGLHYLARSGLLYKWSELIVNDNEDTNESNISSFSENVKKRTNLIVNLQYWTIIGLLLSWDSIYGIGAILGSVWVTWEIMKNGQYNLILLMPALHAFALWNLIEQIDDVRWETLQNVLVGIILIFEGVIFTYISSKSEIVWNWEGFNFDDEKTYFDWLDRIGIMSILYIIIGIVWIMETAEMDSLMWIIISIYLSTVAIQGFQEETDSGWRRSIGGFGSLLSLFFLSSTIEDSLYQSLTWLALGIVAFGFGVLYMQRFGDQTEVFENTTVEQRHEEIENDDENSNLPYTENTQMENTEDELPEIITKVSDWKEDDYESTDMKKDDVEFNDDMEYNDKSEPSENLEKEDIIDQNNLIQTDEEFYFKLSPDILKNIRKAIQDTDYGDFKPVLEFKSDGQIVLNFE